MSLTSGCQLFLRYVSRFVAESAEIREGKGFDESIKRQLLERYFIPVRGVIVSREPCCTIQVEGLECPDRPAEGLPRGGNVLFSLFVWRIISPVSSSLDAEPRVLLCGDGETALVRDSIARSDNVL